MTIQTATADRKAMAAKVEKDSDFVVEEAKKLA